MSNQRSRCRCSSLQKMFYTVCVKTCVWGLVCFLNYWRNYSRQLQIDYLPHHAGATFCTLPCWERIEARIISNWKQTFLFAPGGVFCFWLVPYSHSHLWLHSLLEYPRGCQICRSGSPEFLSLWELEGLSWAPGREEFGVECEDGSGYRWRRWSECL